MVTTCSDKGVQKTWEWDVDPLTREVQFSLEDIDEIIEYITDETLVMHNAKFDIGMMNVLFKKAGREFKWDSDKLHDTTFSAHLINSQILRNLTTQSLIYLAEDVRSYEDNLNKIVEKCRRTVRSKHPDWRIAKKGLEDLPSAFQGKIWKFDLWLPRALAKFQKAPKSDERYSICQTYADMDSMTTMVLHTAHKQLLEDEGLWDIYLSRKKLPLIIHKIENNGVSISGERLQTIRSQYIEESKASEQVCTDIAKEKGFDFKLPKSGNSKALTEFLFTEPKGLQFPVKGRTPNGAPQLTKGIMEQYEFEFKKGSEGYEFVTSLLSKRQRDTAINYMDGYERFWIPVPDCPNWYTLHPSLNPTGTATLRWSCQNPNEQNISKQGGANLRYCFGPAPGREWWSLDANNIELRIPGYESGEPAMIEIFEKADEAPFYGSYHLLIASILHPEKFEKTQEKFKSEYPELYGRVKNFNFADQYGAVMRADGQGTADKAAGVKGAQAMVAGKLKEKAKLNRYWVDFANKHGYVETIPDRFVDPSKGYRLYCKKERGSVLPTVPLNYHVQGTAMWWMQTAMIKVDDYLETLNFNYPNRNYMMIMQVHDELVFDFPAGKGPEPHKTNLPKIRKIKYLMESCGEHIGIPTPVSVEYHPNNWSESIVLAV